MKKKISLYLIGLLLSGLACQHEAVEPAAFCEWSIQRSYTATYLETYTYQYDETSRLTYIAYRSPKGGFSSGEANYQYTYQGQQATIDITYPGSDWLRVHYDVTLNERGYAVSAQETTITHRSDGSGDDKLTASHTFAYNADGHLTEHRADKVSYPLGKDKTTTTYWQRLGYVAGNPVLITYKQEGRSGTISNRYGPELNPTKLPLHLEADRQTFVLNPVQPLLGKPPVNLITFSKETTPQRTDSTRYEYQFDANRQLVKTVLQPGNPKAYAYVPSPMLTKIPVPNATMKPFIHHTRRGQRLADEKISYLNTTKTIDNHEKDHTLAVAYAAGCCNFL